MNIKEFYETFKFNHEPTIIEDIVSYDDVIRITLKIDRSFSKYMTIVCKQGNFLYAVFAKKYFFSMEFLDNYTNNDSSIIELSEHTINKIKEQGKVDTDNKKLLSVDASIVE